ncbi:MAG: hypothetical protein ACREDR_24075 [Blastocatellia bacterium]
MGTTHNRSIAWTGTLLVLVHGAALVLHGSAHESLQVVPSPAQQGFIDVVILAAPVVSVILLWLRLEKSGLVLLFTSMSGAFLFGLYYHFILVSNDNVLHLPPGHGQTQFQITAVAIAVIELAGIWIAFRGLKKSREVVLLLPQDR